MRHDDRGLLISHGWVWTRAAASGIVVPFIADRQPMLKMPVPPSASDEEVRALVERYRCPVPFHEVRTRFLGNIATPAPAASPIRMVESLWGGALPEFSSLDAVNELIGALVMGLWNRLTRHQERNAPFRLMRPETTATRDGLAAIATMRRQELDGFVEGLFGEDDAVDLPEQTSRALEALGETQALFAAIADLVADEAKPATARDLQETLRHTREMTRIAEREMHAVVLACTRARRQLLASKAEHKGDPALNRPSNPLNVLEMTSPCAQSESGTRPYLFRNASRSHAKSLAASMTVKLSAMRCYRSFERPSTVSTARSKRYQP